MSNQTPRTDYIINEGAESTNLYINKFISLSRQLETELADANARAEAADEESNKAWDAFYKLRKQVAEEKYPGMTNEVKSAESRLREVAEKAREAKPAAWIEHHKGGDNLNWDRIDHAHAPATPLYRAHPQTDQCGYDRNGSHNAGHYVCACGKDDRS